MPDYGNKMASDEYRKMAAMSSRKAAHARKAGNKQAAKEHEADAKWYINQHNKMRRKMM